MKIRIKRRAAVLLLAICACLLCGCKLGASVEELFTLPQVPQEYTVLSTELSELIQQGYEYAAPTGGRNIQSVQMVDLDNDGDEEVLAFLHRSSDDRQLKIFIYENRDGAYELLCTVESSGTAIDSVSYEDLSGDGCRELVIGWRISADVRTLAVYRVRPQPEVLAQTSYTQFSLLDLNMDRQTDLLVYRTNESGISVAEMYSWRDRTLQMTSSCVLSGSMADLNRGSIVTGYWAEGARAVYLTSLTETGEAITDILTYQSSKLYNMVMSSSGHSRVIYPQSDLRPQDINSDGIIEVPAPWATWDGRAEAIVRWVQYDVRGESKNIMTTYHNTKQGWYFQLPGSLPGYITVQSTTPRTYETRDTLFSDGEALLHIYANSGENRNSRAAAGDRFILQRTNNVVYSAETTEAGIRLGLTENEIRQSFHTIVSNWAYGEN